MLYIICQYYMSVQVHYIYTCTVSCITLYSQYELYILDSGQINMYGFDIELAHAFLVIIPCFLIILYRIWTKVVAKNQAKMLSEQLNEEFNKLAWGLEIATPSNLINYE